MIPNPRPRSAIALLTLLCVSSLSSCHLPGEKGPTADSGGSASPDPDPGLDTAGPTDSAAPGDSGATDDTGEDEICQECVVWAAANGESYEVTASTLPTDCDGDGLSNTL